MHSLMPWWFRVDCRSGTDPVRSVWYWVHGVALALVLAPPGAGAGGSGVAWGDNTYGQLGNGTNMASWVPMAVGGLLGKAIAQVSAGVEDTCALTTDGTAACWGLNDYGQLGNGTNTNSSVPVAVDRSGVLNGKTIAQVSTGDYHTCALATDGTAACWGYNWYGQLGNGTNTDSWVPVAVDRSGVLNGKTLTQVSAGRLHTCALATDGTAACWGYNWNGQLGNGTNTYSSVPVAVDRSGVLNGKTIAQVSAGTAHTCALATDGTAACWGDNWNGQLGNGTNTNSWVPVAVDRSGVLNGKTIAQVSAGASYTCALATDGTAACWGYNGYGQLGNGTTSDSWVPVAVDRSGVLNGKTIAQVSPGIYYTCALATDGTAACWGYNLHGELGNGTNINSSVPVAVDRSGVLNGKTIAQVSAGGWHTCALATDGTAACWGANSSGQLGDGTNNSSSVPVAVDRRGVLNGKTIAQVSAGIYHTCALATDGTAACWGLNVYGQLGNGTTSDSWVPVAVDRSGVLNGKTIAQVSAGTYHTCALATDGTAACWGDNGTGALGNGTNINSSVPVAVDRSGVLNGKTIAQVSAGTYHTCALATDGTAACWGSNGYSALGDGTNADSWVPVAVDRSGVLNGKTIAQVSVGSYHTCALATDGTAACWGLNGNGALGNGTTSDSCVPVAVDRSGVLNGKTIAQVSAGNLYTCALATDGTAACWGYNGSGQLGNGTNADSWVPVAVDRSGLLSGQSILDLSAGGSHMAAIVGRNANTITATASPAAGGTVRCTPNPVSSGGASTCTAHGNPRYLFAGWRGACAGQIGQTCTLTNITSAQAVEAVYLAKALVLPSQGGWRAVLGH
ncbi:RCC1 domain-containing protein [uncultured Thiodictyon sp.]|uniref:RCC1-like domain-containing protein n=1 Tax=uncultured Thiodictyon sp. TaxID=1846217 RepID=UPI0025EB556F|nr:RCC1 domain-containing protein [uncultured Thiodictyon sp.]